MPKNRNVLCVVKPIHTKTVQIKAKKPQNVQIVGGLMSPITDAVLHARIKLLGNMWSKSNFLCLHSKTSFTTTPSNTFNFTAEQIVSLVPNVVLQIAQPQLCTKNLPEKQVQAKSDLSKQIAETVKKCLEVNIAGKDVFESIISRPAPLPTAPFVFSSMLVEKKKAPLLKASTVLNKVVPPLVTPSSNTTKTTKPLVYVPNASLPPNCHHNNKTRRHLPNRHQTNPPHSVVVNSPSRLFRTGRNHTFHRYEHCFLELSRPQTKTEGTTKLSARKSN